MNSVLRRHLGFWIGSLAATVAANISVSASLFNLFRISGDSDPILVMMVIEALVPLLTSGIAVHVFNRWPAQKLFAAAGLFGATGALCQMLHVNQVFWQMLGVVLTAASASIQKPLMGQAAVRLAREESEVDSVNRIVVANSYVGLLIGYLAAGALIKYTTFEATFAVNLVVFAAFSLIALLSHLEPAHSSSSSHEDETGASSGDSIRSTKISTIFGLVVILWICGGSINVLEVPFARKFMGADEFLTSLLFFSSASGSILFLVWNKFVGFKTTLQSLHVLTVLACAAIGMYTVAPIFMVAIPVLGIFGFATAAHSLSSMRLVQTLSSRFYLNRNTVALNIVTQVTTLGAAAAGVAFSKFTDERIAAMTFAFGAGLLALAAFARFKILLSKRQTQRIEPLPRIA